MRYLRLLDPGWGIMSVRIVAGVILVTSGWQKWAKGLTSTTEAFAKMGIPAPSVAVPFVAGLELFGGALLLVGLFTRVLGLLFAVQFVVITFYVKSLAEGLGPLRLDLMMLAGSLLLLFAGPGRAAIDRAWLERPGDAEAPSRGDVRRVA